MAKYPFRLLLLASALAIASCVPIVQDSITITGEPIKNGTETVIQQWVPEPQIRGTSRIIFSCCVTLFLCVWTTVHVNIEPTIPEDEKDNIFMKIDKFLAKRAIKKLGWSIVSLFVPEIALAVAAYERSTAIILKEKVGEEFKKRAERLADSKDKGGAEEDPVLLYSCNSTLQPPPSNTLTPVHSSVANANTTLVYSKIRARCLLGAWKDDSVAFYAVMGGFRIVCNPTEYLVPGSCPGRVGPIEKRFVQSGDGEEPHCRTLTPWGVLELAKMNLLPHIPVEVIKDKSKVNVLAKVITVFQALWMILQVLARTAARQEVTLLEAHTVLHLICAAAMYLVWWHKPADIDLPTDIALSEKVYHDLVNSPLGIVQEDPTSPLTPSDSSDEEEAGAGGSGGEEAGAGGSGGEEAGADNSGKEAGAGSSDKEAGAGGSGKEAGADGFDKEAGAVSSGKEDPSTGSPNPGKEEAGVRGPNPGVPPSTPPAGNASGATSEITAPPPSKTIPSPSKIAASSPHKIEAPSPAKYVTTRAGLGKLASVQLFHNSLGGNFADKYFNAIGTGFGRALKARQTLGKELATLCIVGLAYGGGHLATWRNTFPTPTEQWMWQACAIVTSIAVASFVLMLALSAIIDRLTPGGIAERRAYRFTVGIIFGVGIFIVLVARAFLLVESFLSLRYLNEEAFQAVAWAHTWPHLG